MNNNLLNLISKRCANIKTNDIYCFWLIDAPVQPKKAKLQEAHKLKKMITKTVNNAMEDELRDRALEGKKSLTKKDSSKVKKK